MGSTSTFDMTTIRDVDPRHVVPTFRAVVKGAGPSGLAAALSIHQAVSASRFNGTASEAPQTHILVVEKRPYRPPGHGRMNMVAIRPEGLRRLDDLGALTYLRKGGFVTDLQKGQTINEWGEGDGIWEWPILRYDNSMEVRFGDTFEHDMDGSSSDVVGTDGNDHSQSGQEHSESETRDVKKTYQIPDKINEQVPCCFVDLGHLEDSLLNAAQESGIEIKWNSSIEIVRNVKESDMEYKVLLTEEGDSITVRDRTTASASMPKRTELGCPDLVVCASGKNDHALEQDLGFRRYIGLKLETAGLSPEPNNNDEPRSSFTFPSEETRKREREIESQLWSVFGLRTPGRTPGHLNHKIRKANTGTPEQPMTDIEMIHRDATHCLIQLPRGLFPNAEGDTTENTKVLDGHLTSLINQKLNTNYPDMAAIVSANVITWGDPLSPVVVETSTAPRYTFGKNVILVGDAGMSCSPASGIGADIGMTVDSRSVYHLVKDLISTKRDEAQKNNGGDDEEHQDDNSERIRKIMQEYHAKKAEASVIWSLGSRMFYLESQEADDIVRRKREIAD